MEQSWRHDMGNRQSRIIIYLHFFSLNTSMGAWWQVMRTYEHEHARFMDSYEHLGS